jgi:hypothetical protein
MKTSFIVTLAAAFAASFVSGSPAASLPDALEKRASCYYPSTCSWFNAAKCQHYCRRNGKPGYETVGVTRMEKCNLLNQKRCCCTR